MTGKEDGKEASEGAGGDVAKQLQGAKDKLEAELAYLDAAVRSGVSVTPADFEKDQDLNFHIDFITAASNLRAANYQISQATRHTCKMISGKIIPAIATTTASICGLVCLEVLKLVQKKSLSAFRDCNINLGVNTFQFFEPTEAKVIKGGFDQVMQCEMAAFKPEGFTKWDKFVVRKGDITLGELIESVQKEHGITINYIESLIASKGPEELRSGVPVYDGMSGKAKKVTEILKTKFPKIPFVTPSSSSAVFLLGAENDKGEPVAVPEMLFFWK